MERAPNDPTAETNKQTSDMLVSKRLKLTIKDKKTVQIVTTEKKDKVSARQDEPQTSEAQQDATKAEGEVEQE